jgi:hypothetical protein
LPLHSSYEKGCQAKKVVSAPREDTGVVTPATVRDVDIAELLAALMRVFAEGKSGYLFATKSGRPLGQRNVLRASGVGLHAFRRFRRKCCVGPVSLKTSNGCGSVTRRKLWVTCMRAACRMTGPGDVSGAIASDWDFRLG